METTEILITNGTPAMADVLSGVCPKPIELDADRDDWAAALREWWTASPCGRAHPDTQAVWTDTVAGLIEDDGQAVNHQLNLDQLDAAHNAGLTRVVAYERIGTRERAWLDVGPTLALAVNADGTRFAELSINRIGG